MKFKLGCITVIFIAFFMNSSAFSFQATFTPRISVSEEYSDNIFLSEDDEEDDFITIVSAGFTAQLLGKTSGLEVSYDPAYTKYADFGENDTWRHEAGLSGWSDITKRTRVEIRDSFLRTEDPLGDEDLLGAEQEQVTEEGDTTIRTDRNTYYRNTASFRISHQFGKDDSIYAGFRYGLLRNNDSQVEDNDNYSPHIGLNYWFGPKFGIQSNATYTRGEFDQDADFIGVGTSDFDNWSGSIRIIRRTQTRFSVFAQYDHTYRDFDDDGTGDNDYMVYAPSAGFTYMIERGLNLRLGAGYFYQSIDNEDDNKNLFGNGQIDRTWDFKRGSLHLAALTGLAQNNFGAENVGLERFAALQSSATYSFLRNLHGDINGFYRYSDVVGDADQGAAEDTGEKVNRYRAGAGLSFEPARWMAIRLSYAFNKVDSENNADDYNEHRGLLRVTLSPSQPYRYVE